ncbi:MAG: pitrilysin family protein [Nitrospiraceae bacterium]|nr:pitrilysin family protein [Nitrospiraceae bacterium]
MSTLTVTKRITLLQLLFAGVCLAFLSASPVRAAIADREVLPNGLTLLHAEKKALPIVKVVVAFRAGSITEPQDKAGLANLTADLLNEGTATRSSRQISEAIEFVGGSLQTSGGNDYVTASLSVLKKDIGLGFELLSDILLHPAFSEQEISRRKALIKSAILQQKEEPAVVASKAFMKAVFGDHPYGWPVEGTEESLDAITRQDIVGFYSAYYAPNNAVMAVVGDISRPELMALIEKYFHGWEKKGVSTRPLPALKPRSGPDVLKIQKDITQANIILGHLGITRDNPDYYAVTVMNYILGGGGFASRLVDDIRDNRGLSYDVHSFFAAQKYSGYFEAGLQTKNPTAQVAIDEVLKQMERIRTEPVTTKELDDAKSYLTGSFPLKVDSNSKIAAFLTAVELYHLGLDYIDNYKGYIQAVTKEDVLRVAKKYLDPKNYVLVIVGNIPKTDLRN